MRFPILPGRFSGRLEFFLCQQCGEQNAKNLLHPFRWRERSHGHICDTEIRRGSETRVQDRESLRDPALGWSILRSFCTVHLQVDQSKDGGFRISGMGAIKRRQGQVHQRLFDRNSATGERRHHAGQGANQQRSGPESNCKESAQLVLRQIHSKTEHGAMRNRKDVRADVCSGHSSKSVSHWNDHNRQQHSSGKLEIHRRYKVSWRKCERRHRLLHYLSRPTRVVEVSEWDRVSLSRLRLLHGHGLHLLLRKRACISCCRQDHTREIVEDEEVKKMVILGPKHYAFEKKNKTTGEGRVVIKVKGITLDAKTLETINIRTLDERSKKYYLEGVTLEKHVEQIHSSKNQIITNKVMRKVYRAVSEKSRTSR